MKRIENASAKELRRIRRIIGEAFVTNALFHEFGSPDERRPLVMLYMSAYTDYVISSKALYGTNDGTSFLGLQYSEGAPLMPQLKLLFRLIAQLPFSRLIKLLRHIRQIADGNKQYASKPHMDILMAAVHPKAQGKGHASQLIRFAQQQAAAKQVPLLADTDMKQYIEQVYLLPQIQSRSGETTGAAFRFCPALQKCHINVT